MPLANAANVFCIQRSRFDSGSGNKREGGNMPNCARAAFLGFLFFSPKVFAQPGTLPVVPADLRVL
jgi:hypothetical protein